VQDPFLVVGRHAGAPQLFSLHAGLRRVTIGRGPANDIPLTSDTSVSRVHAELERMGGVWTVVDDGLSRTGTWVNGTRIGGRHRLRDGDVLQVGGTQIAYRVPSRKKARRAQSAPELTPAQRRVLEALCRPYKESEFATPASNQAIGEELFLSVEAVQAHLRSLFAAFGLDELPHGQRRSSLAMRAMQLGIVR
ncbi:MAG TPA: FHA domain-containing protein, partial [Solirubrobacteraceae bacterium]|nr:FHA domain-containing protein [Solirubrobacteraceae bacterium]